MSIQLLWERTVRRGGSRIGLRQTEGGVRSCRLLMPIFRSTQPASLKRLLHTWVCKDDFPGSLRQHFFQRKVAALSRMTSWASAFQRAGLAGYGIEPGHSCSKWLLTHP